MCGRNIVIMDSFNSVFSLSLFFFFFFFFFLFLSLSLSIHPSIYLSICLSVYIYLCVCVSIVSSILPSFDLCIFFLVKKIEKLCIFSQQRTAVMLLHHFEHRDKHGVIYGYVKMLHTSHLHTWQYGGQVTVWESKTNSQMRWYA